MNPVTRAIIIKNGMAFTAASLLKYPDITFNEIFREYLATLSEVGDGNVKFMRDIGRMTPGDETKIYKAMRSVYDNAQRIGDTGSRAERLKADKDLDRKLRRLRGGKMLSCNVLRAMGVKKRRRR